MSTNSVPITVIGSKGIMVDPTDTNFCRHVAYNLRRVYRRNSKDGDQFLGEREIGNIEMMLSF